MCLRNGFNFRLFSLRVQKCRGLKMSAFRKIAAGVLAIATVSILTPTMASARNFHGGGFRGGWGGPGIAVGAIGLGLGLAAAPYAYGYGYGYPYYGSGYDSYAYGGCYLVRRYTPWGPRLVRVCN